MLYGIKTFWHPRDKNRYDVFTSPEFWFVMEQIKCNQRYRIAFETFITYTPRFDV